MTVVDLFAGMGGWDLAARDLGMDPLGIEWNADAGATREAAGLSTLQADISELDPRDFAPCDGLIASPPCQDFSVAGKGAGRGGDRGQLVDEVPRWVDALRPRWVACEQVPPVLPIWREFAHRMEAWGYRCWTGLLSSERYGVPQTRERAILMASLDRVPQPPAPTHQEYRHGEPARREVGLFGELEPWVSMAEALGGPIGPVYTMNNTCNGTRPGGAVRPSSAPSRTVDGAANSWVLRHNQADRNRPKDADGIARVNKPDGGDYYYRFPSTRPAPVLGSQAGAWVWERPATTIAGDPRCFSPGEHKKAGSEHAPGRSENAVRLTLDEGLTLQGFPPDWPVQGTKTAQWLQVGNAIPPPLARAILAQLVDTAEAAA